MAENTDNTSGESRQNEKLPRPSDALSHRLAIVSLIGKEMLESITEGDIDIGSGARITGSVKKKDRKIIVQLEESDPEFKDYQQRIVGKTTEINQITDRLKGQGQENIDKSSEYADQKIEEIRNDSSLPENTKTLLIESIEGVINNAGSDLQNNASIRASSALNSVRRTLLELFAYTKVSRLIKDHVHNLSNEMRSILGGDNAHEVALKKAEILEKEINKWTAIGIHAHDLFEYKQTQIYLQEKNGA